MASGKLRAGACVLLSFSYSLNRAPQHFPLTVTRTATSLIQFFNSLFTGDLLLLFTVLPQLARWQHLPELCGKNCVLRLLPFIVVVVVVVAPNSDYELTRFVAETSVNIFAYVRNTPTAELQLTVSRTGVASFAPKRTKQRRSDNETKTAQQCDRTTKHTRQARPWHDCVTGWIRTQAERERESATRGAALVLTALRQILLTCGHTRPDRMQQDEIRQAAIAGELTLFLALAVLIYY